MLRLREFEEVVTREVGPHNFSALDEAMLAPKTVLRGEEPQPIDREQYGSSPECRYIPYTLIDTLCIHS